MAENDQKKEFFEARITSYEDIFSKKEPLIVNQLFTPAKKILTAKQQTNESKPDLPPNFILLQGRAGIGKTTFVNFVVNQWALKKLWPEYHWVFSLRFRDLPSLTINEEKTTHWTLEDWIYKTYFSLIIDKNAFQALWDWLIEPDIKNKKILFILDGYDEMPMHHPCKKALNALLSSETPKILTSRPYGLSNLPTDRRELEVVGFVDENIDKYISMYFNNGIEKITAISRALRASRVLWGSAHIPVTLNVLCGVLEHENDLAKLNTMSSLYDTMEMSLLERAYLKVFDQEAEHANRIKFPLPRANKKNILMNYYKNLRFYLSKLAFEAFLKQKLILEPQEVANVLSECGVVDNELNATIKRLSELGLFKHIIDDITHQETKYEFLHLTFQEYYAGQYLLWQLDQDSPKFQKNLTKVKCDPRYQIVLWFVAGAIRDKAKFDLFMRTLAHPLGGDMLGNMSLGLMIRCTEENWELAQETGWCKVITRKIQQEISRLIYVFRCSNVYNLSVPFWIQMLHIGPHRYENQTGDSDLFANIYASLNDKTDYTKVAGSATIISWLNLPTALMRKMLLKYAAHSLGEVKTCAAIAFGKLDVTMIDQHILDALAKLLADEEDKVYSAAAEAIGNLGSVALTREIIAGFATLLSRITYNCETVVKALDKLGPAVATSNIVIELIKQRDPKSTSYDYQKLLGKVIGKLGILLAKDSEFLGKLIQFMHGEDAIRQAAITAVGDIGEIIATEKIFEIFLNLLEDNDYHIRVLVIKTISKFDVKIINQKIIDLLPKLLLDSADEMHAETVSAIIRWDSKVVTTEILAIIPKLLTDKSSEVRSVTVELISKLGSIAETAEILLLMPQMLTDDSYRMDDKVCKAFGKLHFESVMPDILKQLSQLLDGEFSYKVFRRVILAVAALGSCAAIPTILVQLWRFEVVNSERIDEAVTLAMNKLGVTVYSDQMRAAIEQFSTEGEKELYRLAYDIDKFGHATVTPNTLNSLVKFLAHEDRWVRRRVTILSAALGSRVATPEFLAGIIKLFSLGDEYFSTALTVVEQLGNAVATEEFVIHLIKLASTDTGKRELRLINCIKELSFKSSSVEIQSRVNDWLHDKPNSSAVDNFYINNIQSFINISQESSESHRKNWTYNEIQYIADSIEKTGGLELSSQLKFCDSFEILLFDIFMLAQDYLANTVYKDKECSGEVLIYLTYKDRLPHPVLFRMLYEASRFLKYLTSDVVMDKATTICLELLRYEEGQLRAHVMNCINDKLLVTHSEVLGKLVGCLSDDRRTFTALGNTSNAARVRIMKLPTSAFSQILSLVIKEIATSRCEQLFLTLIQIVEKFVKIPAASLQNHFYIFATAIVIGGYLSGNMTFNIHFDANKSSNHLQGFSDKTPFNIPITHEQAHWFSTWTHKILQSFDNDSLPQVLEEIEKADLHCGNINGFVWTTQSASNGQDDASNSARQTSSAVHGKSKCLIM